MNDRRLDYKQKSRRKNSKNWHVKDDLGYAQKLKSIPKATSRLRYHGNWDSHQWGEGKQGGKNNIES